MFYLSISLDEKFDKFMGNINLLDKQEPQEKPG